jgi:hypothetical protein
MKENINININENIDNGTKTNNIVSLTPSFEPLIQHLNQEDVKNGFENENEAIIQGEIALNSLKEEYKALLGDLELISDEVIIIKKDNKYFYTLSLDNSIFKISYNENNKYILTVNDTKQELFAVNFNYLIDLYNDCIEDDIQSENLRVDTFKDDLLESNSENI